MVGFLSGLGTAVMAWDPSVTPAAVAGHVKAAGYASRDSQAILGEF
jgi:hypothetical protein